jgi:hypothetical protein
MNDVVYFVRLQGKHFCKSSSDFVQQDHSFQSISASKLGVVLASGNHDWIVVIVAEFSGIVTLNLGVISEDSAIGIPLSHSRGISSNSLFRVNPQLGSEATTHIHIRASINCQNERSLTISSLERPSTG